MTTIHSGPLTRPATSQEAATFERWRAAITRGRKTLERVGAGGYVVSMCEGWRMVNAPQIAPCFTQEDATQIGNYADRWNALEALFSAVELQKAAIMIRGNDLDVYDIPKPMEQKTQGLEGLPLILLIVGVALVVGAIVATETMDLEGRRLDNQLKNKLADFTANMKNAPPDQRAAWQAFLNSEAFKKEKGIWDKLGDALSGGAGIALLVLLGFLAFSGRRAGSSPAREPIQNPRRRRRTPPQELIHMDTFIHNPCHQGGGGTWSHPSAGGWKGGVKWSADPSARGRQATYIESYYHGSPEVKEWLRTRRTKQGRVEDVAARLPRGTYKLTEY